MRIGAILAVGWMLAAMPAGAAPPTPASATLLAHPVVRGDAGPYRQVTVTLTRIGGSETGGFAGMLDTGKGRRMALAGPDEPADFFILDPRAVLFTPIDRSGAKAVVILYNSSQIGPGHGTERRALVYRITADRAVRQPAIESRLEGCATAAAARAKLGRGR